MERLEKMDALIHQYLENQMTNQARMKFEEDLTQDNALREEFEFVQNFRRAKKYDEYVKMKAKIKQIRAENPYKPRLIPSAMYMSGFLAGFYDRIVVSLEMMSGSTILALINTNQ